MLKKITLILNESEIKMLALISIASLLMALMETFGIGILFPIIDLFINQDKIQSSALLQWLYQITGAKDNTSFLVMLAISAICLFVFKSICSVAHLYLQYAGIAKVQQRLTRTVLASYLDKPYAFHLDNNSAILFKNVTVEVGNFTSGLLRPLVLMLGDILVFLAILVLLIWTSPLITLTLIVSLGGILVFFNYLVKNRIKTYSTLREEHHGKMYQAGQESLQAVKEVQVFNVAAIFLEKFSRSINIYVNSYIKFTVVSAVPQRVLEAFLFISVLIVILVTVYLNIPPSEVVPTMAIFGLASVKMMPAITHIYRDINTFQYYSNSLDITYKILCDSRIDRDVLAGNGSLRAKTTQSIHLDGIQFFYKNASSPIFSDLSLHIPAHKTIAFVGESGAGKSTLVDILLWLLVPSKGILYYGDEPITLENVIEYRKRIGYVPQDITLIDGTIEANIAFGISQDKIDTEALERVLQIAQLESLIHELPNGVQTSVGEKGVKLSGGQKQRIGIARALYHNPEILIMDEATSALDGHTESELTRAISTLKGRFTMILIAHRLSTIQDVDIIYVLDQGRIVDRGSFAELLEKSATFRKIATQQTHRQTHVTER